MYMALHFQALSARRFQLGLHRVNVRRPGQGVLGVFLLRLVPGVIGLLRGLRVQSRLLRPFRRSTRAKASQTLPAT